MNVTAERLPQHLEALETANATRMWRAGFKWSVARLPESAGRALVASLIVERPKSASTMQVLDVVALVHRVGRARARRIVDSVGVVENKTLGTLTDRQANLLADVLTDAERVG